MAADDVVARAGRALIGHVLDVGAGEVFEQLAGHVVVRSDTRRRIVERAGLRLGERDELLHGRGRHARMHDHDQIRIQKRCHRHEVAHQLERLVGDQRLGRGLRRRHHQEGVAVGSRLRRRIGADDGPGAWPVLHDERLMQRLVQFIGDGTREDVGWAAGTERHDHSDRAGRIVLRRSRRSPHEQQHERKQDEVAPQHGHSRDRREKRLSLGQRCTRLEKACHLVPATPVRIGMAQILAPFLAQFLSLALGTSPRPVHQFRDRPDKRLEHEVHHVVPARNDHSAEDHIGLENVGVDAVDVRTPPGMPNVRQQQNAASWRVDIDIDLGVGVAQQARTAAHAHGRAAGEPARRLLQQHGFARIDRRPAGTHELVEIGEAPIRQQHDAWQRTRVFVDVGILGARDEVEIAGLERGIDLLHRDAGSDEAHAEEVGESRAVGRIERREPALPARRDRIAHVGRVEEPA